MFMSDKQIGQLESKLIDAEDAQERFRRENERLRKKHLETKGQLEKALSDLE